MDNKENAKNTNNNNINKNYKKLEKKKSGTKTSLLSNIENSKVLGNINNIFYGRNFSINEI